MMTTRCIRLAARLEKRAEHIELLRARDDLRLAANLRGSRIADPQRIGTTVGALTFRPESRFWGRFGTAEMPSRVFRGLWRQPEEKESE